MRLKERMMRVWVWVWALGMEGAPWQDYSRVIRLRWDENNLGEQDA